MSKRYYVNKGAIPAPKESEEQQALFQWAEIQDGVYPELALMFHIPNGGLRHPATGARMKAEGVKPGVPDICLPVPKPGYNGLYIELKRKRAGEPAANQTRWIHALRGQGYMAEVCYGADEAIQTIMRYLTEAEKCES